VRLVGIATTLLVAILIVGFLGLLLVSLPDLARYRRLRRM
jgi:hypothetical protein